MADQGLRGAEWTKSPSVWCLGVCGITRDDFTHPWGRGRHGVIDDHQEGDEQNRDRADPPRQRPACPTRSPCAYQKPRRGAKVSWPTFPGSTSTISPGDSQPSRASNLHSFRSRYRSRRLRSPRHLHPPHQSYRRRQECRLLLLRRPLLSARPQYCFRWSLHPHRQSRLLARRQQPSPRPCQEAILRWPCRAKPPWRPCFHQQKNQHHRSSRQIQENHWSPAPRLRQRLRRLLPGPRCHRNHRRRRHQYLPPRRCPPLLATSKRWVDAGPSSARA